MQVCTSLQTDNHASTPPFSFYRSDALPAARPTASKHWRQLVGGGAGIGNLQRPARPGSSRRSAAFSAESRRPAREGCREIRPCTRARWMPSVLWRCWLGGRKGIRPVKNWVVRCWRRVICLERGAGLHTAQPMPLPLTVSCSSKIQIGFTFLVPAHLGSPGKGPLNGCVCYMYKLMNIIYRWGWSSHGVVA